MEKSWYPGLMAREEKRLKENLKFIDLVLEVLDARLPLASRNYRLQKMLGDKKRLVILNKADLAEEDITGRWLEVLAREKWPVLAFNAREISGLKKLEKLLLVNRPENLQYRRSLRLMVVGIPNVGKSTIINRLVHKFAVKTGEKAGITRGPQWIRLRAGWEMMDTPGLLSPYFKNNDSALALAAIGSLDFKVVDEENTAKWLVERFLTREKFLSLIKYYVLADDYTGKSAARLLVEIGLSRGCLQKGGGVDKIKAAQLVLRDFRRGVLGRITLEKPEDYEEL
ncbi:MAG: ribosome biogenesis GTPase YlqF [Dethiobacter sp.]|jgi:ribosome biogenesis GTPase A|nr:MAG: ribosome biogenesis GTPase YlqF [Dethiobacter sp.]